MFRVLISSYSKLATDNIWLQIPLQTASREVQQGTEKNGPYYVIASLRGLKASTIWVLFFWGDGLSRDVLGFEFFSWRLKFLILDVGFSVHGSYLDLPNISDDGFHPHPLA